MLSYPISKCFLCKFLLYICAKTNVQSVPTFDRHTHRLSLLLLLFFGLAILELSLQVVLHPLSEQTKQWFAPLPSCHRGHVQTLSGPPGLPGICWVTELTFIKGSSMESYGELTVLSSRCTVEFRDLRGTHPSLFSTMKETTTPLSTVWPPWEWQLPFPLNSATGFRVQGLGYKPF